MTDASGKAVTPGFIDIHRHCDIAPFTNPHFGEIELAQGITSTFVGNCGLAPVPSTPLCRKELYDYLEPVIGKVPEGLAFETYEDYWKALEAAELPINIGFLRLWHRQRPGAAVFSVPTSGEKETAWWNRWRK